MFIELVLARLFFVRYFTLGVALALYQSCTRGASSCQGCSQGEFFL